MARGAAGEVHEVRGQEGLQAQPPRAVPCLRSREKALIIFYFKIPVNIFFINHIDFKT